jgi:hypothetical protein
VPAYTRKATTGAIACMDMVTAMLAARINNIVRTLREIVSYGLRITRDGDDANFTSSHVSYIRKCGSEREFPQQRT